MEGVIKNFRRGRHTVTGNQMIVYCDELKKKEDAEKFVGKKVVWKNPEGKGKVEIKGEVKAPHGTKGALRITFEKGMPGQAVGTKVIIS